MKILQFCYKNGRISACYVSLQNFSDFFYENTKTCQIRYLYFSAQKNSLLNPKTNAIATFHH